MTETLIANGVDLSSLVHDVTSIAGLLKAPKRRGSDLAVPGRHGLLRRSFKLYDSNEFVLPMWVIGADPDTGDSPADSRLGAELLYARLEELVKVFTADRVVFEHHRPDGTVRQAVCEMLDNWEPDWLFGGPMTGQLKVPLTMADPFWAETTPTSMTFTVATGTELDLTAFAPITAPVPDVTVEFGPCSNPELSQIYVGSYLAYDGIISAGRKLLIDVGLWRMSPSDGTAWNPGYATLRHGGVRGPWFQIAPEPTRPPKLIFTHTGGGTATVTISGRRRYLTG